MKKIDDILSKNIELEKSLQENPIIKNDFIGMLKNIERIIPEDSRENFYTNLEGLTVNINNTTTKSENVAGFYDRRNNQININQNMLDNLAHDSSIEDVVLTTIYHEMLHMASTTRDESTNYYASGFVRKEKDTDGNILYEETYDGLTEGFTEKLTLLSFDKDKSETDSEYEKYVGFSEDLISKTTLETMKKSYFNNRNGMDLIEEKLMQIDGKNSHEDLYLDVEKNYNKEFKTNNISIEEIEKATEQVKQSDIDANIQYIEENIKKQELIEK